MKAKKIVAMTTTKQNPLGRGVLTMFGGLAIRTVHVLSKVTFPFFCGVPSCAVVWNDPSPVPEKGKKEIFKRLLF